MHADSTQAKVRAGDDTASRPSTNADRRRNGKTGSIGRESVWKNSQEVNMADITTPPLKKAKTPFRPGSGLNPVPTSTLAGLTRVTQDEPPIEKGVDLSGKPKIIFAAGRGKTGKTTLLRWIEEVSIARGGEAILADVDPTNATFSLYFDGVQRPEIDDTAGVTAWLSELIDHCINEKQSAVIDLGGGDTTLRALATEMPGLVSEIEAAGLAPVMLYLVGTQPEDLTPAVTLAERGFTTKAQALVFNEFAVPAGQTRKQAFARIRGLAEYERLMASSIALWMPRLFAADAIESRRASFFDARDNKAMPPLGTLDRTRIKAWLDQMDQRFAGIASWIP
jgi:hypothetical protein